jgi:hypothetical protein
VVSGGAIKGDLEIQISFAVDVYQSWLGQEKQGGIKIEMRFTVARSLSLASFELKHQTPYGPFRGNQFVSELGITGEISTIRGRWGGLLLFPALAAKP